jgi:hypothetical protein
VKYKIDPQTGEALEKICHAVDYLHDEYWHKLLFNRDTEAAIDILLNARMQLLYRCRVPAPRKNWLRKVWNA